MMFWGPNGPQNRFLPCNAIDIMLKLSIVWRDQIMFSEPLGR